MRRLQIGTRLRVLLGTAAFALFGCPGQELAPLTPCTISDVSQRVDQAGVSDVDLLFMIDNSGSMASKQQKLADQLPRLLKVLTSGDRCAGIEDTCTLDDNSTPKRMFTPVKSLHLGVVTSNMGGVDDPQSKSKAIQSCAGLGDDGVLQNSTEIASMGVFAESDGEFGTGTNKGDQIIAPLANCSSLGAIDNYQTYDADDPSSNLMDVEDKFACVSRVGVRGCPFEQQLEAPWKALAPSNGKGDQYTFLNGSDSHGDTDNDNFLRPDAILAILLVTDEDDCSITDAGKVMFVTDGPAGVAAQTQYGNLNTRCGDFYNHTDLIHDTSRYINGFKSLKPDNEGRVIFAAITGVPQAAIAANSTPDEILALPEMQFTHLIDPNTGKDTGLPNTSCVNSTGLEVAYPPIRIVQVAKGFEDNGLLYSVCSDNYAPALDLLIEKIANKLTGNCLPHSLNPDAKGQVNCVVYELLPSDVTSCDPKLGLDPDQKPQKLTVKDGKQNTTRMACLMNQVHVSNQTPATGELGWYYDYFSDGVEMECGVGLKQRISFQFADGKTQLPSGAGATFECFQHVARNDLSARGFDAINSPCSAEVNECAARSNGKTGGYDLTCLANSCQVICKANPGCPPGWICATGPNGAADTKYCQQPTCPPDDSDSTSSPDAGT